MPPLVLKANALLVGSFRTLFLRRLQAPDPVLFFCGDFALMQRLSRHETSGRTNDWDHQRFGLQAVRERGAK